MIDKIILSIGVISILIMAVLGVFGVINLENRSDECNNHNGILVKTAEGYKCFDRNMVKTL